MAYTETTNTSYGGRLGKALKGVVGGIVMFGVGTGLLWWNEGRSVKTADCINEAEKVTVVVDDVSQIDPEINGKLIHASAFANTTDTLYDDLLGAKVVAIKLDRSVEYLQYVEHQHSETHDKIGGGEETVTTYTYELEWVDEPVESSSFKDPAYRGNNFVLTKVSERHQLAKQVSFGAYELPEFIKQSISGDEAVVLDREAFDMDAWRATLRLDSSNPAAVERGDKLINIIDGGVYLGDNPYTPVVGDVFIGVTQVLPKDVSIIAKVNNKTFGEYVAKNGQAFSSVAMGVVSAPEMFQIERDNNRMLTWGLRLTGLLLVIMGLKGVFSILPALFKVLPFLGNIVEAGVGVVCSVFGFAWSLLVVAIAWLFYRPVLGIVLLVVSVALMVFLVRRGNKKKAQREAEQAVEEFDVAETGDSVEV